MSVDLNTVLELLVDEFLVEKIDLHHDAARESFRLETLRVSSWPEFLSIITRYWLHHTIRTKCPALADAGDAGFRAEYAASEATAAIDRAFRGGKEEAYLNALTGQQGGLKGVIDRMAEQLKLEQRGQWTNFVHMSAYDAFKWEDMERLATEFLEQNRHRLPPGAQAVPVGMIAHKLREHIDAMAEATSRVRRTIQRRY